MASSADVDFEGIHIELIPKQKSSRSSPKLSPSNRKISERSSNSVSKWAIVREKGIALALTSIGKTPGQKANSSDANARVLIAAFVCCDANLQFTVARRSKIVVGRHCGASKSAATARPTLALRRPPHAASQAKTLCDAKNVIVYLAATDVFHGFESWKAALAFIAKEQPQSWWLDSKEPPDFDTCQKGKESLITEAAVVTLSRRASPKLKLNIAAELHNQMNRFIAAMPLNTCICPQCRLLCPWTLQYSWEREDGKSDEGDLCHIFEKTPRDQFAISESQHSEIMLFSLNMPMCGTKMAESFFPKHPMVTHLNSQHNFFNPSGESETSYGAACDSRMKDRNFDMPYVMLRGKNFFVTYGWSLNNVCHVSAVLFYDAASIIIHLQSLRHSFVSTRSHKHLNGFPLKDVALDEIFSRAFELCCSEIEQLVDECTAGADACDEKRELFATADEISKQKDFDSNEYLTQVYNEIVNCNRLIRNLLPKKAVFQTVENSTQGESTWPVYIGKSCAQRLEAAVSVFSYLESRAYSNLEQLKSLQDSCLSMINLGMTKQGYVMNIIMQRFAVVTMIFAPLTLATGFFGMNVPIPGPSMNVDEGDGTYTYFWAILGGMALCTILMWMLFKKMKLFE